MCRIENRELQVVSFDENKVMFEYTNSGNLVVVKRTSQKEIDNMAEITKHLSRDRESLVWNNIEFKVKTARVISWDSEENLLLTEHFDGDNLELLLRSQNLNQRKEFVDFTKAFIGRMKKSGTLWVDAAPRNILINIRSREICILDFEKGCLLKDKPYTEEEFRFNVRGFISEEFGAFLFPEEQDQIFGSIWSEEDKEVSVNYLRGKRERILYTKFFGEMGTEISLSKVMIIQRLMLAVVTPYFIGEEVFSPLVYLAESQSAEEYVGRLLDLISTERSNWSTVLVKKLI